MTDQPSLLRRVAEGAWAGLRQAAISLAAFALALVALVAALVGVTAKLLAVMLSELAGLLRAALPWLLTLAPWLSRCAVAAAACYAVVMTWPGVFLAYSADMPPLPAGALATIVVVAPIALAVTARRWGALIGAVAVMLIIGRALIVAGPLIRAFAVIIVMAAMSMSTVFAPPQEKRNEL